MDKYCRTCLHWNKVNWRCCISGEKKLAFSGCERWSKEMTKVTREEAKEAWDFLSKLNRSSCPPIRLWEEISYQEKILNQYFSQTCEIEDNGYIFCPTCGEKIDDPKP